MAYIPKKVRSRLVAGIKRFQPIIRRALDKDINEADTVAIVADIFARVFGYDKYTEITREYVIRGTYCDLAIVLDDKPSIMTEVKAIGLDLKIKHMKQAIDYAANKGVDWVVLTNGRIWKVFRVTFGKPINHELVLEFDFLTLNSRNSADLECLYALTREGVLKSALNEYQIHRQAINRFLLGAVVVSDPVLKVIRRELKRLHPNVKVRMEEIKDVMLKEVLKREVVEGERASNANKKVTKGIKKNLTKRKTRKAKEAAGKSIEGLAAQENSSQNRNLPASELQDSGPS